MPFWATWLSGYQWSKALILGLLMGRLHFEQDPKQSELMAVQYVTTGQGNLFFFAEWAGSVGFIVESLPFCAPYLWARVRLTAPLPESYGDAAGRLEVAMVLVMKQTNK
jgi:hypothetical protein